jgi:hypothetical protein
MLVSNHQKNLTVSKYKYNSKITTELTLIILFRIFIEGFEIKCSLIINGQNIIYKKGYFKDVSLNRPEIMKRSGHTESIF